MTSCSAHFSERNSKLLIRMNQWVNILNIIFFLWCRSANNALVKLKTTTTAKSNVKYRYSAGVTLHNFKRWYKNQWPSDWPQRTRIEFYFFFPRHFVGLWIRMINVTVYFIRHTFVVGKQKWPFWEKVR